MKRAWVPVLGFVLALALAAPAGASHSWGSFHWGRSSNPVNLTVVDSVVGAWDTLLPPVVSDWDQSTVLALSSAAGDTSSKSRRKCSPILGKVRTCNQRYGFNGWLGLASIWLYSGTSHIAQATTKVNDSYFDGFASLNNNEARRHVLCQEVGHDFGLDHQVGVSCMNDNFDFISDPAYVDPDQHDYDQLATIYTSHFDSSLSAPTSGPGRSGQSTGCHLTHGGQYDVITCIVYAN